MGGRHEGHLSRGPLPFFSVKLLTFVVSVPFCLRISGTPVSVSSKLLSCVAFVSTATAMVVVFGKADMQDDAHSMPSSNFICVCVILQSGERHSGDK